jgi:hypothetical protein
MTEPLAISLWLFGIVERCCRTAFIVCGLCVVRGGGGVRAFVPVCIDVLRFALILST